jgi:choline transport protein
MELGKYNLAPSPAETGDFKAIDEDAGYQRVNLFAFFFNCYGKILPRLATITLYTSLISFFVILVVVPARAESHQDTNFVFATFINNTGWS